MSGQKDKKEKDRKKIREKHNKYPKFPVRIKYLFGSIQAEGEMNGRQIRGYPGMVDVLDNDVTSVQCLYDGDGLEF